jgi:hypothetical protein
MVGPAERPLAVIFARTLNDAERAAQSIREAYAIAPVGMAVTRGGPTIKEWIRP